MRTREDRIKAVMLAANCSYEDAVQVIEDDEAIDKGERLDWEPTIEEEKEMRKATRVKVDRKPSGERKPREREADNVKREIVAKVAEAMGQYENVEIANVEREVTFVIDGAEYSLTLTKHRKSKK